MANEESSARQRKAARTKVTTESHVARGDIHPLRKLTISNKF